MFGLMKQNNNAGGDMPRAKGSVLGSSQIAGASAIDPAAAALVQLCAAALPQMNGILMTAIERALHLEPRKKPALRKFIADSYSAPQSPAHAVRSYKRAVNARHADHYRLAVQLCNVAREAGRTDSSSLAGLIKSAKALGLSKDEVLRVLQKAHLTA